MKIFAIVALALCATVTVDPARADYAAMDELDGLVENELETIAVYRATLARHRQGPTSAALRRLLNEHTVAARLLRKEAGETSGEEEPSEYATSAYSSAFDLGAGAGGLAVLVERETRDLRDLEAAISGPKLSVATKERLEASLLPRAESRVRELSRMVP